MTFPEVGLLVGYAALLWLPGGAVGALAGLRGWALAALAPLLTYGLVTVDGSLLSWWGVGWRPGPVGVALVAASALVAVLRGPLRRWTTATRGGLAPDPLPVWTVGGQVAVAVATVASALFGMAVLLSAFGGMSSIPQDWDAMLHANGIRYIAETGDSSVYGMTTVNTFAGGTRVYYPNTYHLMAALVLQLTGVIGLPGVTIPAVLNAQTLLMPFLLALTLVAVVRSFRGRVVLAMFVALVSPMATAVPYDLVWRGPLLPFATGLLLVLGALIVLQGYLDRPSVLSALPLVLAAVGLLGLHASMLFTAALFVLPLLVQRWWRSPRRIGIETALLVAPAAFGAALVIPHLVGATSAAPAVMDFSWPQTETPAHALGEVFAFSTDHPYPQVVLLVLLVAGAFGGASLGRLRWLPLAGVGFAVLYVLAAAYGTRWAQLLTSPWWNDKYRLAAIATMALLPVVANGLVFAYDTVQHRLVLPISRRLPASPRLRGAAGAPPSWACPVVVAGLVAAVLLVSNGGYAERNIERTSQNYGLRSTVVTPAEQAAFDVLAKLVQPGERVMNDRYDGSGWMYALAGVRPVAGHYNLASVGADPTLLSEAFNQYDTSPEVQAAVARLHVRWVIVGPGFVRSYLARQEGLVHLDQVSALDLVYDVDGVQIYRLARPLRGTEPATAAGGSG